MVNGGNIMLLVDTTAVINAKDQQSSIVIQQGPFTTKNGNQMTKCHEDVEL